MTPEEVRQKCLEIALAQYTYWRGIEGPKIIEDIAMGAAGASANIVAEICRLFVEPE